MSTVTIYGTSDDLVEIEGSVPGCDEYNVHRGTIVFEPTGDRFSICYSERGTWDLKLEACTGRLSIEFVRAPGGVNPCPYTDTVTVSGDVASVQFWNLPADLWPPEPIHYRNRVEQALGLEEGALWGSKRLTDELTLKIWDLLGRP